MQALITVFEGSNYAIDLGTEGPGSFGTPGQPMSIRSAESLRTRTRKVEGRTLRGRGEVLADVLRPDAEVAYRERERAD
jgi:hypothetical protein